MNEITFYRDAFTYDNWKELCYSLGIPTSATSFTILYNEADVSFEEEEQQ